MLASFFRDLGLFLSSVSLHSPSTKKRKIQERRTVNDVFKPARPKKKGRLKIWIHAVQDAEREIE